MLTNEKELKVKDYNRKMNKAIIVLLLLLVIPAAFNPIFRDIAFIILGISFINHSLRWKNEKQSSFYISASVGILLIIFFFVNIFAKFI